MSHKLRIRQTELYKLSIPLIEPFSTSLGTEDSANNVLIKIITDEGIVGYGECSPYMPINGETPDTCLVVGQYFAQALKGRDPLKIGKCIKIMDEIIYGNTSIKSAFDMALYDIAAQHAGLPLYKFLGGENNKDIITDYTVSIGEPEKMAADALQIKEKGYPAIKVKLGKEGAKDVERIKAIREKVGNEIPIRIDANQGWKVKEAIETLNALAAYNIQYCEEPIAKWKFMQLKKVRKNSPIPIMADESCGTHHDAERLIKLEACDMFNIKLVKTGGIYYAKQIAMMAEEANMPVQVGAMLESRLGMTAFAHFALSSPAIEHYDFDTALMFSQDPVTDGIRYESNGLIHITDDPGLGASIDATHPALTGKVVV